jgi:hypothetical protein
MTIKGVTTACSPWRGRAAHSEGLPLAHRDTRANVVTKDGLHACCATAPFFLS